MAKNEIYLAVGEEATRSTAESTTVGFVPVMSPSIPTYEPEDRPRAEFRGEASNLGDTNITRYSTKWSTSIDMPFFTEAGTVSGMVGTILKHFFGDVTSAQNAATGQYYHMMYPVTDMFATGALGTKGLTLNMNINEGATVKNWPFKGGRVRSLSFDQEAGQNLKVTAELFGTDRDASGTAIATPTFAAENLRCDYNNLTVYTGTITRTGTAPNYTAFTFGSATQIKPDKISVKLENGTEDVLRLAGLTYADKTRMGKFKATFEITLDWEDPASGFSSADDFNSWVTAAGSTNFFLYWNTGTQAGTGDTHSLYIDLPICQRMGGSPEYSLDKDPLITLKYEALMDTTTTQYLVGIMLKNTATAV